MKVIGKVLEHLRGLSGYNARGEELPDPVPAALEVPITPEMTIHERVFRALQSEHWNQRMASEGLETMEEANDFDVPEEQPEFKSVHEDESGDVIAFEEGVRSGFVEEIPKEKVEAAKKVVSAYVEAAEERIAKEKVKEEKRLEKHRKELEGK